MSELLTREQVERLSDGMVDHIDTGASLQDWLDTDAALRAKLEAVEARYERLNQHARNMATGQFQCCEQREKVEQQLAAMTQKRDYAQQMITTQESIIENLGRERDRYKALLEGKG